MKRLSAEEITRARAVPLVNALEKLGYCVSKDGAFEPRKTQRTMSVFISNEEDSRELILTGEKWFDKTSKTGGGGAIDLVVHLKGGRFTRAVRLLLAD